MNLPPLILVRHGEVAARWKGICYGSTDVELSPQGEQQSETLAARLATEPVRRIVHSGLGRSALLAERLADLSGIACEVAPALRERDFGIWEGRSWDEIFRDHGDEMLRMISEPDTYRPGGGETTAELRDRVLEWFARVPEDGLTVAITHGGPIAALVGTLGQLPIADWPRLIPGYAESVRVHELSLPRPPVISHA